jgi:HlyD family secretion protein
MIVLSLMRSWIAKQLAAWQPRDPRQRRRALVVCILAGCALISASIFATGPAPKPVIDAEKAWPVSVIEVTPADLSPTFATYGRVESTRVARLQSDLDADIVAVHVREGQWVEAGAALIELEPDTFELHVKQQAADLAEQQAALASLGTERRTLERTDANFRAMYEIAQKKLARHSDLFARHMIAQSLLDEVVQQASQATIDYQNHRRALADMPNRIAEQRARIDKSAAALKQAQIDLEHTIIRAPFAGPVLKVTASPGDHTVVSMSLVEVADADAFEIRAPVPDVHAERVRRALIAGATIDAHLAEDGRRVALARLSSSVRDGQTGLDAFFTLAASPSLPEIGRVVELDVTLPAEPNVVALPVQALYDSNRIYAVAADDRLEAITVQRVGEGRADDGAYRVLVRSAELKPGSRILTTQLPKAISGLRVAPI